MINYPFKNPHANIHANSKNNNGYSNTGKKVNTLKQPPNIDKLRSQSVPYNNNNTRNYNNNNNNAALRNTIINKGNINNVNATTPHRNQNIKNMTANSQNVSINRQMPQQHNYNPSNRTGNTNINAKKINTANQGRVGKVEKGSRTAMSPTTSKKLNDTREKQSYLTGKQITTPIKKDKVKSDLFGIGSILIQLLGASSVTEGRIVTRKKIKKVFPIKIIFIVCICVLFSGCWLITNMAVYENDVKIAEVRSSISVAQKKQKDLELSLEAKNKLQEFEEYAINNLGMIKRDLMSQRYISIRTNEKIELSQPYSQNTVGMAIDAVAAVFENVFKKQE